MGMPIIEGSNTTKIQALTDILVSIALEETAIAHILNAEGEKIQRVVADEKSTTCELLCINKSVDHLADTLTNLEMLLKSKMKLVLNDTCYLNLCDHVVPNFELLLSTTAGTITARPNTENEYDLVVAANNALMIGSVSAKITVATTPSTTVTIPTILGFGVNVSALLNVITIEPIAKPFEGTAVATIRFGVYERTIIIHVTESSNPCDAFSLILTTGEGGSLTKLPGDNNYEWRLLQDQTGNIATIITDDITVLVTGIVINTDTVSNDRAMVYTENNTITLFKFPDYRAQGQIDVTVNIGQVCTATVHFDVQTLID